MSLKIYAQARAKFVTGAWSWPSLNVFAQLLDASYVVDLENDSRVPTNAIGFSTQVTGRTTDSRGYCRCNPIYFDNVANAVPITQIVLYDSNGGYLAFHIDAYPIPVATVARPIQVLLGGGGWLFRV